MREEEIFRRLDDLTRQIQGLTNVVCELRAHSRGQRDASAYGPNGQIGESQQDYFRLGPENR